MVDLKIVVNNTNSVLHKVLQNLKDCAPKPISIFHAIRNIPSISQGIDAVDELVKEGIVEATSITTPNGQILKYYRYCSEYDIYRRMAGIYPVSDIT